MSKRKPRIATARQGSAFDGVFATPGETESEAVDGPAEAPPPVPPQPGGVPTEGDPLYDRTVQANWTIPNWIRAKVRAAKDFDGMNQNEVVRVALANYLEELEEGRGDPYPVQRRHFE